MKQIILIILSFLLIATAQASRKALLIGNADYHSRPLANPINDVTDIKKQLIKLGFTVTLKTNLSRKQMRNTIRTFRKSLKQSDEALVYYSGHGAQVKGENYLIPVNNDIKEEFEISDGAVSLNFLLENLASSPTKLNIVILDACRDNPFKSRFRSSSRGLARLKQKYSSTLVAFAASEGGVSDDGKARNGVYTKHLLKHIATPGISLNEMLTRVRKAVVNETGGKQFPVEENSLLETVYLVNLNTNHSDNYSQEVKREEIGMPKVYEVSMPRYVSDQSRAFINNNDGTITDTKTGLMWKKCTEGQYGSNCTGNAILHTWDEAMLKSKKMYFADYYDWRIPSVDELTTLFHCNYGEPEIEAWGRLCKGVGVTDKNFRPPTIRLAVFPSTITSSWYWSSSVTKSNYAKIVGFDSASIGADSKSKNAYVRLVRSGQ